MDLIVEFNNDFIQESCRSNVHSIKMMRFSKNDIKYIKFITIDNNGVKMYAILTPNENVKA